MMKKLINWLKKLKAKLDSLAPKKEDEEGQEGIEWVSPTLE